MKLKSESLRQNILMTTTDLIIAEGIEGTSTVKVAKQLNISQSNIYSYFKNKKALLLAVFSYHQKILIDMLSPALNDQITPRQQIDALLDRLFILGLQEPKSIKIILNFRQQPSIRPNLPSISESTFFTRLFELIQKYQEQKIIKNYDASFLAENVFSIVVNYLIFINFDAKQQSSITQADVITLIHGFLLV